MIDFVLHVGVDVSGKGDAVFEALAGELFSFFVGEFGGVEVVAGGIEVVDGGFGVVESAEYFVGEVGVFGIKERVVGCEVAEVFGGEEAEGDESLDGWRIVGSGDFDDGFWGEFVGDLSVEGCGVDACFLCDCVCAVVVCGAGEPFVDVHGLVIPYVFSFCKVFVLMLRHAVVFDSPKE